MAGGSRRPEPAHPGSNPEEDLPGARLGRIGLGGGRAGRGLADQIGVVTMWSDREDRRQYSAMLPPGGAGTRR